jgi:hypothetical protein
VSSNTDAGYATVDYMFYSAVASARHGRTVEGNLKLLSR